MEASSPRTSSSSSLLSSSSRMSRGKFVKKVMAPAIEGKSCPICLSHVVDRRAAVITVCLHAYCFRCIRRWSDLKRKCPLCNAHFDSLFYRISLSSQTFLKEKLRPLAEGGTVNFGGENAARRVIRRYWDESNSDGRRTRPLPWRRSFGRPGSLPSDVVAERILQWRASIYSQGMQAVPFSPRNRLKQNISGNSSAKERILQRIEPWIRRELHAILHDPDPAVIVHVATSLFVSSLEESTPLGYLGGEDDFLAPLRSFLHNQTSTFWHELSCFAESTFNMETYDAVVKYEPSG
ncbi:E3 ubiquitin-protein ligase Topors isoform X1 [Vitis riparia]|uniref:E3 ubiquitin-protein ligase Topors isoform X1 n=1 Tax=Vitis riparia TaxID=96939 RepID=UPI00155A7150|nr:E3 ubiquitin-protein ligase Topors isoform X1 [Vitis riparia]